MILHFSWVVGEGIRLRRPGLSKSWAGVWRCPLQSVNMQMAQGVAIEQNFKKTYREVPQFVSEPDAPRDA